MLLHDAQKMSRSALLAMESLTSGSPRRVGPVGLLADGGSSWLQADNDGKASAIATTHKARPLAQVRCRRTFRRIPAASRPATGDRPLSTYGTVMATNLSTQQTPRVHSALRRPAIQTAVTLGACAVVGTQVSNLPDLPPVAYLLVALASLAMLYVCLLSARWCLIGLLVATTLGFYRHTLGLGAVDLRVTDVFYVALVAWVVAERSRIRQARPQIGQRQIGWFLAILTISIFSFHQVDLVASSVSMARFIQTLSLLWLVPYATRTARDRVVVVNVLLLCIASELLFGLLTQSGDRFAGQNGPDTEGLLAAILLVAVSGAPR